MRKLRLPIVLLVAMALLWAAAPVWAKEKGTEDERWHSVYYEGKKRGQSHTEYLDFTKEGAAYREIDTTTYVNVRGSSSYSSAKVSKTKHWTFSFKGSHKALLKDKKVIQLKSRRTGTKAPILRAKSKLEGDTLVIERTEGVIDKTLRIKPSDYDLVAEPAQMEPFLETVTTTPIKKNVFLLGDAEVREQTFVRLDDSKTKDVDGVEKPCKAYKMTDEDGESKIKTIKGKVVYLRHKDEKNDTTLIYFWTSAKRAKSDTGY